MGFSDEETPLVSNQNQASETRIGPWERYCNLVDEKPLLIKGVSAFFILGVGDLAGQGVEHILGTADVSGVDWIRAGRFGCFGLIGAPWAHYYFFFLDKYLPPTEKPCSPTTGLKLLIDQGLQAPSMLVLIISSLAILKGGGMHGVKENLHDLYLDTLYANWKLWIPASLFNLAFVEPSLRVLYVNVVFFFWTIILSIMVNR